MSDDTQDLLEFGTIDVFYVVWYKPEATYYLSDMSPDFSEVQWTKKPKNGFYFYTDTEAIKIKRHLGKYRHGIGIEPGEIDIIDEISLTYDI